MRAFLNCYRHAVCLFRQNKITKAKKQVYRSTQRNEIFHLLKDKDIKKEKKKEKSDFILFELISSELRTKQ